MHVVSKGIYYDTSTKGKIGHHHHAYRAEVVVNGIRRRARFLSYSAAVRWVTAGRDRRTTSKRHSAPPMRMRTQAFFKQ